MPPPPTRPRPTTPPLMMPAGATELQPPNIPHTCVADVVIACTMGAMDVYLVEQNAGARRLGVGALALAGDLFFLLVLRYATAWVGGEARPAQRGYAVVLWFLFAFALEIKLYFIYQHYATEGRAPDPLARRTLTLLLSICVPALYMVLGATEMVAQAAASFRKRGELQGRLFWVVLDLLDVLEIQASLWEPQRGVLPLWAEGLAFFYCYGLLLVLPCVSLSEMGVRGPHPPSGLYPLLSLASVNVATLFIRGGPLLLCHDQRISSIFMGKNVLAIALKGCAALQQQHHHHHHQATRARDEVGHGGSPGGQSLPSSPAAGQQLHRYVGTAEEGCHTHAALPQPPLRCSQSTAGHSRRLLAGAPSQGPARTPSPLPHRHPPSAGNQPHCLAQFHHHHHHHHHHQHPHTQILQGACHYGHTAQPSPTALPGPRPSASRILRAGPHVQLKSVLAHEALL